MQNIQVQCCFITRYFSCKHTIFDSRVKCPKLEVISGYVDAAGRGFCTATPLVRYVCVAICVP